MSNLSPISERGCWFLNVNSSSPKLGISITIAHDGLQVEFTKTACLRMQRRRRVGQIVNTGPQQLRVFLDLCVFKWNLFILFPFSKLNLNEEIVHFYLLVSWLNSWVFPFRIDNSVPVSCDVAAGACFFSYGCIGSPSTDGQNISVKPYLTLPYCYFFALPQLNMNGQHCPNHRRAFRLVSRLG